MMINGKNKFGLLFLSFILQLPFLNGQIIEFDVSDQIDTSIDRIDVDSKNMGLVKWNSILFNIIEKSGKLLVIRNETAVGLIDTTGNTIVEPKSNIKLEVLESAIKVSINDKQGLIDFNGDELLAVEYDQIKYRSKLNCFQISLMISNDDNNCNSGFYHGLFDVELGFILLPEYCYISLYDSAVGVKKSSVGYYAIVDLSDLSIAPVSLQKSDFKYERLSKGVANNNIKAMIDGKWGLITKDRKISIPFEYKKIKRFTDSLYVVKKGEAYGIVDHTGEIVFPINNNLIVGDHNNEYADQDFCFVTNSEGLVGLLDNTLKFKINPIYNSMKEICRLRSDKRQLDCYYMVDKEGRHGVIDVDSNIKIPIEYDKLINGTVEEDLIASKDGKYGLINYIGQEVIKIEVDEIIPFYGNLYKVRKGKWGLFNNDGEQLLDFEFDVLENAASFGFFTVSKNQKFGVVREDGTYFIPLKCDSIIKNGANYQIEYRGKSFLVDNEGNCISDCPNREILNSLQINSN